MAIFHSFRNLTKFERILWLASITVITLSFLLSGDFQTLTLIASLIGVTALIFVAKGDVLVLLTDGVTECANSAGEQFGIERAESVLLQSRGAEDFIGKLKTALTVFSGGAFSDDITAIAFDL